MQVCFRHPHLQRLARSFPVRILLVLLLALPTACNWNPFKQSREQYDLQALTAELRVVAGQSTLTYQDACGEKQALAVTDVLTKSLATEMGEVFRQVQIQPTRGGAPVADRVIEVEPAHGALIVFVTGKDQASYPGSVKLGANVSAFDAGGTLLAQTRLVAEASGEIETDGETCRVYGVSDLVVEAANELAEDLAAGLSSSKALLTGLNVAQVAGGGAARRAATPGSPADAGPTEEPTVLSFRALVSDQNRNQVLEGGETVRVEIEVANEGPGPARDVQVVLSGSQELVQRFTNPVRVGDLQPGEAKAVSVQGKLVGVARIGQAELVMTLTSASPGAELPARKRFLMALRPKPVEEVNVLSVDVDQVPAGRTRNSRRQAVGIAIGISRFRDSSLAGVKYAVRDAETMADYYEAVMGIPKKRIKLATNDHALRADLVDLFRRWLPPRVKSKGEVFVFVAGRAVVDPSNGALSIVPYDGNPDSPRRLISLTQVQVIMARLKVKRAVFILDLSVMPSLGPGSVAARKPSWDGAGTSLNEGRLVQIFSASAIQETLQYDEGRHGLFTYYVLKGLGGEADRSGKGVITAKELCDYVRTEVEQAAKSLYGSEQVPQCIPPPKAGAKAWASPMAKLK